MGRQKAVRRQLRQRVRRQQRHADHPNLFLARLKRQRVLRQLALWLFHRHTVLLLLLAWAGAIGATTAAIRSIVDPDASVPTSLLPTRLPETSRQTPIALPSPPSPVPVIPAPPITTQKQPDPSSPLAPVSVMILSCAAGCFLLSRCLTRSVAKPVRPMRSSQPSPQRKVTQPEPLIMPPAVSSLPIPSLPVSPSPAIPAIPILPAPPAQTQLAELTVEPVVTVEPVALGPAEPPADAVPEVTVTVMPSDHSHPLDWDEPSLADSLDLRQRRPLSYWL